MNKAEKHGEVEFLAERFRGAQISLCADYRGLTVAQFTKLRRELASNNCKGRVVKNTLARLAINKGISDSTEREKFHSLLVGPSLVIYSDADPIAPAKIVAKFQKDFQAFQIKGAWFEDKFIDKAGVEALSSMPSREETLAKLLALINTPATQLLRLMNEPASQVVRVLAAQKDKLAA